MRAHTRLEISWDRLAKNFDLITRLAPRAQVLPMVKADAYGHGLLPVGRFLTEEVKVKAMGVATLAEGESLTQGLPGFTGRVYVFSDTMVTEPEHHRRYAGKHILPVIHDLESLKVFLRDPCFKHLPLTLKLNTGMNRLGIDEADWERAGEMIVKSGRTSIQHLMSHFSRAAQVIKPDDKCHRQEALFRQGKALFQGQGLAIEETSLANSGAIEQGFAVDETWVRPGLMLYGPWSCRGETQMVSSLITRIMKVFPVKKGTPVGYGTHVAGEDGLMAVLPIGYGDGFPTQSTGFDFSVNGEPARVFGRVNMDMAFLFFRESALGKVHAGDEVRFWHADPATLIAWADHMNTHAYQALCGISNRVPRVYRLG